MTATDGLTGLPGQRAFRSALERLDRLREPFSVLLLDLDSFKVVNGNAAHARGDWLLRRTAQAIAGNSPEGARTFRIGGDEFAALLPVSVDGDAVGCGERICAAVAAIEIPEADGPDPCPSHVSCSIGVASYPADGQTAAGLVEVADRRLYLAKHMGGGHVVGPGSEGRNEGAETSPHQHLLPNKPR